MNDLKTVYKVQVPMGPASENRWFTLCTVDKIDAVAALVTGLLGPAGDTPAVIQVVRERTFSPEK